ncbi:MAG: CBS domain-containing protein [Promethearchaeota archaeon]
MSRNVRAIDIARKKVFTCRPDQTIPHVAKIMKDNWIGSVIVVEQDKPIGIVTDGIIFSLIAKERNPLVLLAQDVMVAPVFTIHEDADICDSEDQFLKTKVKRLAVVNDEGQLVGVLSKKEVECYTRYSLAQRILNQKKNQTRYESHIISCR